MLVRISAVLTFIGLLAACAPAPESARDTARAACEFGPGQSLGDVINSSVFDGSPTVSRDETELFFTSDREGGGDILVSMRPDKSTAWGAPINAGAMINDSLGGDFSLRLSEDGKTLYFASNRGGGFGSADMYVATRASPRETWARATNMGPLLNTQAFEAFPTPSADGLTLYFNRSATFDGQDSDMWVTTRASTNDPWGAPQRVSGDINSERADFSPSLTADDKTMYFASERAGSLELWVAARADRTQEWGAAERLAAEVNVARSMTLAPFISSDRRSLYFMSARQDSGTAAACTPTTCFNRVDLYVATLRCP